MLLKRMIWLKEEWGKEEFPRFVMFEDGNVYFIGEVIADELDLYLRKMEDIMTEAQYMYEDSIASEELMAKLSQRTIVAMQETAKLVNLFTAKIFKKKNCHEIIVEKLMDLHEVYEKVTNRININDKRINDDYLFNKIFAGVVKGEEVIEGILSHYNIRTYVESQRDVFIPETQTGGFRIVPDKECPISTLTVHTGFYDEAHHRLLRKEFVVIRNMECEKIIQKLKKFYRIFFNERRFFLYIN